MKSQLVGLFKKGFAGTYDELERLCDQTAKKIGAVRRKRDTARRTAEWRARQDRWWAR
jgi:hypothetical protein